MTPLWRAYGAGHYGKSLMWHGSELLFAFYLTEACGLAPPAMAAVVAAGLFASGLLDIVVGHGLRARIRTVSAAALVQSIGAVASGVLFVLFLALALAPRSGPAHLAGLALALGLGFRLAYALYDVPQNAVLALAPVDDEARGRLSSLRFVCSGLASLTLAPLAPLLLAQDRQAEHFAAFGAGVALVAIGTSLAFMWTARRTPLLSRPALVRDSLLPGERSPAGHAGALRAILPLLGLGFVVATSSAVFMKLEPYFIAHYLAATLSRTAVMLGIAAGGIASQPFTVRIATRRGLAPAFRCAALVLAAGAAAFMALGGRGAAGAGAAGFVVGFGLNGLGMLIWTTVGNLSAGAAARQPLLAAPLAFGLLTFTQKTASVLGTVIVGAALELRGADVAPAIMLAMGLVPLSGAAACLAFARRLHLPERHVVRRRAGCAEDAARTP